MPASEILFEDFAVAAGWVFSWVSIVTLHPATVFWRAAFPVFPLVLFFSKPPSSAAPWPCQSLCCATELAASPPCYSLVSRRVDKPSTDKPSLDKPSLDKLSLDKPSRCAISYSEAGSQGTIYL